MKNNSILRWLLLATPFVLLVNPNMYFPFIAGKNILFRGLVDVCLVSAIFSYYKERLVFPRLSKISFAVLIFTFIILLADIFALNPFKAFFSNFERSEGFVTIFHLSAYFFLLTIVFKSEEKLWHRLFSSFIVVGIAGALFGLVQILGGAEIN